MGELERLLRYVHSGEQKDKHTLFASLLPWKVLLRSGNVILCANGGLLAGFRVQAQENSINSALWQEDEQVCLKLHRLMSRISDSNVSWHMTAHRVLYQNYPQSHPMYFSSQVAWHCELERRAEFAQTKKLYTTETVLWLHYQTYNYKGQQSKIVNLLLSQAQPELSTGNLDNFLELCRELEIGLQNIFAQANWLAELELLKQLRLHISCGQDMLLANLLFPLQAPHFFIDQYLSDAKFIIDEHKPCILRDGKRFYLGTQSVVSLPQKLSFVLTHLISRLPFACSMSVRACCLSAASLQKRIFLRKKLYQGQNASNYWHKDSLAERNIKELNQQSDQLEQGETFAEVTATIICWDHDYAKLQHKQNYLQEIARKEGILLNWENYNSLFAFMGALPGECQANVRRLTVSLGNYICMCPWWSISLGRRENFIDVGSNEPAIPLTTFKSEANSPYHFSTHRSQDAGHCLIAGTTGAGKSVLLNFLAVQSARFGGRVLMLDKGGSAYVTCSLLGGDYYRLDGASFAIWPLRELDSPRGLQQAANWLLCVCGQLKLSWSVSDLQEINQSLSQMSYLSPADRSLENFLRICQSPLVNQAIKVLLSDSYCRYFDRTDLPVVNWRQNILGFDLQFILADEILAGSIITHIFTQIENGLDGASVMICVDELWDLLRNNQIAAFINQALRQFRKKNAYMVLATQSIKDCFNNKQIADSIVANIRHWMVLASPELTREEIKKIYYELGFRAEEIKKISQAQPRRDFMIKSYQEEGTMIKLELGEINQAVCCATSQQAQRIMNDLLVQGNGLPDLFIKWLEAQEVSASIIDKQRSLLESKTNDWWQYAQ